MIDFSNFKAHPENPDFVVFFFDHQKQADYFELLLKEKELYFEKEIESKRSFFVYYAVKRVDLEEAKTLNSLSRANTSRRFIPDKALRITVLFLFFVAFGLAITGFIMSKINAH